MKNSTQSSKDVEYVLISGRQLMINLKKRSLTQRRKDAKETSASLRLCVKISLFMWDTNIMKHFWIFLIFCSFLTAEPPKKKTICLNMIVKNESHVIRRCLDSVMPIIDTWVIVDTGSTDGTQEVIKEFFKDIPGELYERPWVNFEHNRNEALQLAKDTADYLLFIDADDILQFAPSFKMPVLDKDYYAIILDWNDVSFSRAQLVKSSLDWKWEGVIHEMVGCTEAKTMALFEGVRMKILGGGDRSRNPQKSYHDALALEKALLQKPNNPNYIINLAQSYQSAGMYELAFKNYQRYLEVGIVNDLDFWSRYQMARILEILGKPEDEVVKGYLDCYNKWPQRTEPLCRLSSYYRRKDKHLMSYLVARHALHAPHPDVATFVEPWVYQYGILLEYSISAYWIGHYEEAYHISQMLLANPSIPAHIRECVEANLKFIKPKLPPGVVFHPLKKAPSPATRAEPAPRQLKEILRLQ